MEREENEYEEIQNAGKIHFILENYEKDEIEKKRLFIKVKQIRKYKLKELLNISTSLDLPDEINNNGVIKNIIDTFKEQYGIDKKNKDICIIFEKEEDKKEDNTKEDEKGIIYYYRDEKYNKIKIFSKCDIDDKNYNAIKENFHKDKKKSFLQQNNIVNNTIEDIKKQIKDDSKNCKEESIPLLTIKDKGSVQDQDQGQDKEPIALYLNKEPQQNEDPQKDNKYQKGEKPQKGGNRVDIFKLLELFAIDNGIIFEKPKNIYKLKKKIDIDLLNKDPLKDEDPLKDKESHLLLKKDDFYNIIEKSGNLKKKIENIKKKITEIILIKYLRNKCFPQTNNNISDRNNCFNINSIENDLLEEILKETGNTSNTSNTLKIQKKFEENYKYDTDDYIDELNDFQTKEFKTLFKTKYTNDPENEKKKKRDYLDSIYKNFPKEYIEEEITQETTQKTTQKATKEKTKENIKTNFSNIMKELKIDESIKKEMKEIKIDLFGVINSEEKRVIEKRDEVEPKVIIKNLTNSKEDIENIINNKKKEKTNLDKQIENLNKEILAIEELDTHKKERKKTSLQNEINNKKIKKKKIKKKNKKIKLTKNNNN